MPVIIVLNENGRLLDRAPVLAFDMCFPVANVPVITVLNENGRLDRAPVLAFDICVSVANTPSACAVLMRTSGSKNLQEEDSKDETECM